MAVPAEATTGRTAQELAARANEAHALSSLSAGELERWLVSRGLAELDERRRLHATEHGRAVASAYIRRR